MVSRRWELNWEGNCWSLDDAVKVWFYGEVAVSRKGRTEADGGVKWWSTETEVWLQKEVAEGGREKIRELDMGHRMEGEVVWRLLFKVSEQREFMFHSNFCMLEQLAIYIFCGIFCCFLYFFPPWIKQIFIFLSSFSYVFLSLYI